MERTRNGVRFHGGSALLGNQAAQQLEAAEIEARLDFPQIIPAIHLSANFRRNVLLITKEAIHNALKHAGATCVTVRLAVESSTMVLTVTDDGGGLEHATGHERGNGLDNMRRRAQELQGHISITSGTGGGTKVQAIVPLQHTSVEKAKGI